MNTKQYLQRQLDDSLFAPNCWEDDEIKYREFLRRKLKQIIKEERK